MRDVAVVSFVQSAVGPLAGVDELQRLHEELDLADAAAAELDVHAPAAAGCRPLPARSSCSSLHRSNRPARWLIQQPLETKRALRPARSRYIQS